jgi:hypothetical protein
MLIERTAFLTCAALLGSASFALAQPSPVNLQVNVEPTATFLAGNVTRVSYVVANRSRSTDRLFEFAVRSPVEVWRIELPGPRTRYAGATREGDDHVASWSWLENMPRPGESSPILTYEAIGLPGIVAYRALRYFGARAAPIGDAETSAALRFDSDGPDYTIGKTVGVESLPLDLRPTALTRRLKRLVDEACALGWITDVATCRSLWTNTRPSMRALRAFHRELVAQHGKAVSEAAFALLAPNVEFVLGKL